MRYFSSLLFLLITLVNFSQVTNNIGDSNIEKCNTTDINDVFYNKSINNKLARERAVALTKQKIQEQSSNRAAGTVYTIPVVFHIIHKGESIGSGINISDAQINSAIDALNRDYRRTSADGGISQGAGPDAEIEFCLAKKDPSGNAHSGINRVDGRSVSGYDQSGVYYQSGSGYIDNDAQVKALSKWDNRYYLNIWVVSEIKNGGSDTLSSFFGGNIGYSYHPSNPVTSNQEDGVVILYCAVGNDPSGGLGYSLWFGTKLGKMLTHEVGHFLDLDHTFYNTSSCSEVDCNLDGDGICDTPPTVSGSSCSTPACTGAQVENYMDYTAESCQDMFSAGQVAKMRAVLAGVRNDLVNTTNCNPVASPIVVDFTANITTLTAGGSVNFTDLTTGTPTSWTWNFGGGGSPNTSSSQNPTIAFNAPGVYDVSLTVSDGSNSDSLKKTSYITVTSPAPTDSGCLEIFISEYVEGSGGNQVIELYNPTNDSIDITNYRLALYQNGSPSMNILMPLIGGTYIYAHDTYIICDTDADPVFKNEADLIYTDMGFTGNDAILLLRNLDTVDIFGKIGEDPGSLGWGSITTDKTLVRKSSITKGVTSNPLSFNPSTEWIINPVDYSANIAAHNFDGCNPCVIVYDTLNANICTGDSVLFAGNYYNTPGNYNDTTLLLSGCDSITTLVLANNTVCSGSPCSELFISEYIEGSVNNKALEIYNPTTDSIDLSNYYLKIFPNGSVIGSTISFSGDYIYAKDVYVIVHSSADSVFIKKADKLTSVLDFNGNDAIALLNNVDTIDFFGKMGEDPGALGWSNSTKDKSLVRRASVNIGITSNPSTFNPTLEWDINSVDDSTRLGFHVSSCDSCVTVYKSISDSVCAGDSLLFGSIYYKMPGNYADTVVLGAGCDSITNLSLTYKNNCNSCTNVFTAVVDSICTGDSVLFGGVYYNTPGTYKDTIVITGGCDSVVTLNLSNTTSVTPSISISSNVTTICPNQSVAFSSSIVNGGTNPFYQWKINGINAAANGANFTSNTGQIVNGDVITCYLVSSSSCANPDTVYSNSVTIMVGGSTTTNVADTICQNEYYLFNGDSLTTSGIYYDTLANTGGCDSVIKLTLQVYPSPVVISSSDIDTISVGGTVNFYSNGSNASSYVWDFGDSFSSTLSIVSHTYNTFGTFTVTLKGELLNGCFAYDTLTVVVLNNVGVNENDVFSSKIKVYPNPVKDEFSLAFDFNVSTDVQIQLFSVNGELLQEEKKKVANEVISFNGINYEKGVYFLYIKSNNNMAVRRLVIMQ